ncbi:MAG: PilZ domain-containing protein [Phycisphaerae bacterium]|nr:PilZ domain-containing protein [Phycisphaerae bacterium]
MTGERRQFRRFTMEISASTLREVREGPKSAAKPRAFTVDLQDFSLGGLCVMSQKPLKKQEQLTVSIPPHGGRPRIDLTGRVVHCRREANRYAVGIEFAHTKQPFESSPWLRVPSLFRMAGTTKQIDA